MSSLKGFTCIIIFHTKMEYTYCWKFIKNKKAGKVTHTCNHLLAENDVKLIAPKSQQHHQVISRGHQFNKHIDGLVGGIFS